MDERLKRLAVNAGGIVSNNLGGYVWSIRNSQGNSAIDQAFSSLLTQIGVPQGTPQKLLKTAVFDAAALGTLYFTEDKEENIRMIGDYGAEFFKGLGTSTIAADPTYILPNMGSASRAVTTNIPPAPPPRISNALI